MRLVLRALSLPLFLGALSLLPAPRARADIYQCTAKDGSVHYTNDGPRRGMRCRVLVRGSKKKAGASSSATRRGARSFDAGRYSRYDAHLREAARLYQLPFAFLRAVAKVESDFNPEVVSHVGAMGLMQLMPRTASAMGVRNPFDPRQNILGGARYLRILANKFNGDLVLTIAGYNAGEGAVMRYRGVPPYAETQRYVKRVLQHYYEFRRAGVR